MHFTRQSVSSKTFQTVADLDKWRNNKNMKLKLRNVGPIIKGRVAKACELDFSLVGQI